MSPNEVAVNQSFIEANGFVPDLLEKVEENDKSEERKRIREEYEAMINQPFFKRKDIKWINLIYLTVIHAIALYGFITFPYLQKKLTFLWAYFLAVVANFGVAGGVHRLWAHRSYKAKLPLRAFLMLCYLTSGQYSAIWWIRDHRIHHKFSETDSDPVNAARGFWYSHVGWLTMKRHPETMKKGRECDLRDCYADPVIKFEEKYFQILRLVFAFIIPVIVPVYYWNETWYYAILSQVFMRYAYSLNCTWGINSFAHLWGGHPYDKNIQPAENLVMTAITGGEGWHNYHHVFPWDYKAAELGNLITGLNLTTFLIDISAKFGWAYDLKQPSKELIQSVIRNRGDGTHPLHEVDISKAKTK